MGEERERREVFRILVSESLRLYPQGKYLDAGYYGLTHQKAQVREPSMEEIFEGAGLEVTHDGGAQASRDACQTIDADDDLRWEVEDESA